MRIHVSILWLLLPLTAGAVPLSRPSTPNQPPAASAPGAAPRIAFSTHPAAAGALPAGTIGREAAAELRASGWPGPRLDRDSLLHVDLARSARLGLVTRPEWRSDPQGRSRLNLGVLSLRW